MAQISTVLHVLSVGVFVIALLYAAISDVRTLEIANWIPVTIILAFLPAAILSGIPGTSIAIHYGTALIIFSGGAILFTKGLAGGGDVKFLAAVCAWWNLEQLGRYLVAVALLGGVLGLIAILASRMDRIRRLVPWLEEGDTMKQPVPYGIAIAGGALIMFDTLPVLPDLFVNLLGE